MKKRNKIKGETRYCDVGQTVNIYVGNYVSHKWSNGRYFKVIEVGMQTYPEIIFGAIDETPTESARLEGYGGYYPNTEGWIPIFYIENVSYGNKRPKQESRNRTKYYPILRK